jgi:Uma2 family endonuclease
LQLKVGATVGLRVPDITVIDQISSLKIERYVTAAPVSVFEILSPEDPMPRVMAKLEEYSAMGIGQIWLINPESGIASRYRDLQLAPDERFSVPAHGIDFALSEIKALLPKRLP